MFFPYDSLEILYESDSYGPIATQAIADFYIEQARHAWSQACITFEEVDPIMTIEAPLNEFDNNIFGTQVYRDELENLNRNDILRVFRTARGDSINPQIIKAEDVVYIFLGPPFSSNKRGLFGLAFSASWENGKRLSHLTTGSLDTLALFTESKFNHIHLSPQAPPITLAHEFGHILGRYIGHDLVRDPHIIFPAMYPEPIDLNSDGIDDLDFTWFVNYQVNMKRRLPKEFIETVLQSSFWNNAN